jgi:N-acetylglucosaminyl-diphospho-decaprenol L-rhamnosyltransferase
MWAKRGAYGTDPDATELALWYAARCARAHLDQGHGASHPAIGPFHSYLVSVMRLLSIIVNYKTCDMTFEACRALMRELQDVDGSRVMIVDNDSQDGSYETLVRRVADAGWSSAVEVIASDENGGFGYGNNLAIRRGLAWPVPPDYFYVLNSDAFPDPGAVRALIEFMDGHPDVGIAGSYIHGIDGRPHETAFRFPTVASEFENTCGIGVVSRLLEASIVALPLPKQTCPVDWLAGASMMLRRQVIEEVGLFDEKFFLYYEETDLCRRAKLKGWQTYYVVESSVAHVGSASTGYVDVRKRTPSYWFDSRRYYFLKNHGRPYLWATNAAYVTGAAIQRLRRAVFPRPHNDRPRALRDFISHNFRLQRS